MQLIASVLGHVELACGIEIEALAIADAGRIALGGREFLAELVGVVFPDARPRLLLDARLMAFRVRHAVLDFAGVRRRAHADEKIAVAHR